MSDENIYPILSKERMDVLTIQSEQVFMADNYPTSLKRYLPRVIDDGGKDKIVRSFYADGTKAAILSQMIMDVMSSMDPIATAIERKKREADKKGKPETTPPDPFTEKELEKRGKAKTPDFNDLKAPEPVGVNDVLRKKPVDAEEKKTAAQVEGELFCDDKGRWWKIIDGKKRQQKKPKK